MVYECEKCQSPLGAGMLFCPYCGEKLPTPVPAEPVDASSGIPQMPYAQQSISNQAFGSYQKSAPTVPVKKTSFAVKFLIGVGAVLAIFWIIGAASSGNKATSNTPMTTGGSTTPPAVSSAPALTPEQKHKAAVKAQEQSLRQERLAREQQKAERIEAKRQAREQAKQVEEEAKAQRVIQEAQQADEEAYANIKAKVQHDYPNDYITQKGVYDMAVDAYHFMKTVPNDEMKAKVENDYPNDYVTQKGVYEMAAQAKHDMQ